MLYRNWIKGSEGSSRAREVLGSLDVEIPNRTRDPDNWARKKAYTAAARSIIIHDRGLGTACQDIERQWGVSDVQDIEEKWRDEMLWLLSGIARLCELRCFFYHLIENCRAGSEQIRSVRDQTKLLRRQAFELMEQIKYCSALGPMLRSIRRTKSAAPGPGIGVQTIRRLEESGITAVSQLVGLTVDQLVSLGVRKHIAKHICAYVRRRGQ